MPKGPKPVSFNKIKSIALPTMPTGSDKMIMKKIARAAKKGKKTIRSKFRKRI